jgi:hypothetical protein
MERARTLRWTPVAALLLAACGGPPADPIERLIHDVSEAVEDRDADAVGRRVAEDFRGDGGMSRADALGTVRRYFAAYEKVGVQVFDVQRPDATHLRFRVDFTGKPKDVGGLAGLLPSAAVYEFEVELVGEGDALKVRQASWRQWQPPPSP